METEQNKQRLFRGFRPDKTGPEAIIINGEEIRGEWEYWNELGELQVKHIKSCNIGMPPFKPALASMIKFIPETIGQRATTDKKGKGVFEGSIIKFRFMPNNALRNGFVGYCEEDAYFYVDNGDEFALFNEICDIELIGDKWEMQD
jgi:hypothetical protein